MEITKGSCLCERVRYQITSTLGTLDDEPQIHPFLNIFYKSKADWYVEANELVKYQELPTKKG